MKSVTPAATIKDLRRQIKDEQYAHALTRQEVDRVWRLVPDHYINLMRVYPSLRQLFHVLAEAADRQDPSRGVPTEDTARTQFVHVGEHASTSQTEQAVETHSRERAMVKQIDMHLDQFVHTFAQWMDATVYSYSPPEGVCLYCGTALAQAGNGRPRLYCSDLCRVRSSRNVTKQQPPQSIVGS